jgi:hypothetical protein
MTSTYLHKYAHSHVVTPVKTGVQKRLQRLDSGFPYRMLRYRRNDVKGNNAATNFDR